MSTERQRRILLGKTLAYCCLLGFLIVGLVGDSEISIAGAIVGDSSRPNAKRSKQLRNLIRGDAEVLIDDTLDGDKIEILDDTATEQQQFYNRHLRFFPSRNGSLPLATSTISINPFTRKSIFGPRSVPVAEPIESENPVPTPAPTPINGSEPVASENPVTTPAPMTGSDSLPSPAPVPTSAPVATSSPVFLSENVFDHNSPQATPTPTLQPHSSFGAPTASAQPTPNVATPAPTPEPTFIGTDTAVPA